jgi:hypothetical protein
MVRFVLVTTLFASVFMCFGQTAEFVFESAGPHSPEPTRSWYTNMQISINGQQLNLQDTTYTVSLLPGIDTMLFDAVYGKNHYTVLAELKLGERYRVTYNECSGFEIIPGSQDLNQRLVRLISVNRDSSKWLLNSPYCFIDSAQVHHRDTTDYFTNATSGFCPYAPTSFDMCPKHSYDLGPSEEGDCHGVIIYFSGGEMFTLVFDYSIRQMSISFDGYYEEGMDMPIRD